MRSEKIPFLVLVICIFLIIIAAILNVRVVELVDTLGSGLNALGCAGSTPVTDTIYRRYRLLQSIPFFVLYFLNPFVFQKAVNLCHNHFHRIFIFVQSKKIIRIRFAFLSVFLHLILNERIKSIPITKPIVPRSYRE